MKLSSLIIRYSVLINCAKEKKLQNKQQKGFANGGKNTIFVITFGQVQAVTVLSV